MDARSLAFLLCFAFFGMIELAHDLTFLGALLRFLDLVLVLLSPESSSSTAGEGRGDSAGTVRAGSETLDRFGTEGSHRRGSDLKKLRRLAGGEVAVGVVGLLRPPRIAPAVLGRVSSSTVLSVGRPFLNVAGLDVPELMTDDRLFVAEWPRNVDRDVSVSEEMVESGRMYSTLSEKPTRAREGGRGVSSAS